jgi:hypothetical protein
LAKAERRPGKAVGWGTSPYTIFTAQISVSYFADVFGLDSRKVESLAARAEAQHFELEATYRCRCKCSGDCEIGEYLIALIALVIDHDRGAHLA